MSPPLKPFVKIIIPHAPSLLTASLIASSPSTLALITSSPLPLLSVMVLGQRYSPPYPHYNPPSPNVNNLITKP